MSASLTTSSSSSYTPPRLWDENCGWAAVQGQMEPLKSVCNYLPFLPSSLLSFIPPGLFPLSLHLLTSPFWINWLTPERHPLRDELPRTVAAAEQMLRDQESGLSLGTLIKGKRVAVLGGRNRGVDCIGTATRQVFHVLPHLLLLHAMCKDCRECVRLKCWSFVAWITGKAELVRKYATIASLFRLHCTFLIKYRSV
ncbi:unnamed protein product [Schistocephalus solidus]|uniref:2-Hacid_dh_C domain-containing protein n=1 Tax=Schistocephalus solidus TaxID=70667 RepID=A0A183TSP0_SCHSO|nr:unnamed protein product [Schistocephalus solidus]